MFGDPKAETLALLHGVSTEGIAALSGGLTLISANLHHLARLESLAMAALAGKAKGRRDVTRTYARRVVNGPLQAWVGFADDPLECLATQAFTHNGGTHVFVAPEPNTLCALRHVAAALVQEKGSSDFLQAATGMIQGGCALSDLTVSRAALRRNAPAAMREDDVRVPPERHLRDVMNAVRFSGSDVVDIQRRTMLRDEDLAAMSSGAGGVSLPSPPWEGDVLPRRPFLRVESGLVLLAPHRLAEAILRRVLDLAVERDEAPALAEQLHSAYWSTVDRSLRRLGMRDMLRPHAATRTLKDSIASHAIYQCDADKALHVTLYSDAGSPGDRWATDNLREELSAARAQVSALMSGAEPPIREWMTLVLLGSMGRDAMATLAAPEDGKPGLLLFNVSDLEDIVAAEGAERSPLLLWKYNAALGRIGRRGRLLSLMPLDSYAAWRDRGRTFPSALRGMVMPVIQPGSGAVVREEAARNSDWHAIPAPDPSRTVEVSIAEGPGLPIYATRSLSPESAQVAIELRGGPIVWIVSSDVVAEDSWANWLETARMMAYWISEFGRALVATFQDVAKRHEVLVVELRWLPTIPIGTLGYAMERTGGTLLVQASPGLLERYDTTNTAEREFARSLLVEVLGLGDANRACEVVDEVMDETAPIGVKRMLHAVRTNRMPEFMAPSLPAARHPHAADLWCLRQDLLATVEPAASTLAGKSATSWLNSAVATCFRHLHDKLAGFDGAVTLERLMINNEALVRDDAYRGSTLPSRLACFGADDEHVARILQEVPRQAAAAMATRFLVELTAAGPPAGANTPSDQDIDELLAMAATIVAFGIASDVGHFRLADVAVQIVDGDVLVDQGTYDEAASGTVMAVNRSHVSQERQRTALGTRLDGQLHQGPSPTSAISQVTATLDAAAEAEFGVTLSELGAWVREAIAWAHEHNAPVVKSSRADIINRFSARLGWSTDKVERAIAALVLEPRLDYLTPPAGFEKGDIWPWRFNRGLSYIRRPLVQVVRAGEPHLWFTPGHIYSGAQNLVGLITTARYKARSIALSQAMGPLKKEASDVFNEQVGQALRDRGLPTHTQVKRVGLLRVVDACGADLGDLDVVAFDKPAKQIFVLECKDFELARVPHEVRADLEELFVSEDGHRSVQEKHERRVEWVRAHVAEVVRALLDATADVDGWKVRGAFIFSAPLISPLLGHARLPVRTLAQVREGNLP